MTVHWALCYGGKAVRTQLKFPSPGVPPRGDPPVTGALDQLVESPASVRLLCEQSKNMKSLRNMGFDTSRVRVSKHKSHAHCFPIIAQSSHNIILHLFF